LVRNFSISVICSKHHRSLTVRTNSHRPPKPFEVPEQDQFLTFTYTAGEVGQLDSELSEVLTEMPNPLLQAMHAQVKQFLAR
jgi:hypothetical protein